MAASETQKTQAAVLFADGGLTQAEIAESVGVTSRTLRRWLADDPDFRAKIEGYNAAAELVARSHLLRRAAAMGDTLGRYGSIEDGTALGATVSEQISAADKGLRLVLASRSEVRHAGSIATDDAERLAAIEAELSALESEPDEDAP